MLIARYHHSVALGSVCFFRHKASPQLSCYVAPGLVCSSNLGSTKGWIAGWCECALHTGALGAAQLADKYYRAAAPLLLLLLRLSSSRHEWHS